MNEYNPNLQGAQASNALSTSQDGVSASSGGQSFPAEVLPPEPEQRIAGLTKSQYDALNAKHNNSLKIYGVTMGNQEFDLITRKPTQAEADQHSVEGAKARERGAPILQSVRNFLRTLVVVPDLESLDAYMQKYPLAATSIYEQIMKEIGSDAEVKEKAFR